MGNTQYGRYQAPESPNSLLRLHFHRGGTLTEVDHEPKVGVLDQEDLHAQGILCSTFIPGAGDPDALGSCTANATTAALSTVLSEQEFLATTGATSYQDTVGAEKWAIKFYHQCSSQTADSATEWPPTDCGSSGPYIVKELEAQKLVKGDRIAHGADNIVSLMQTGGLLVGQPFFNAWEDPDSNGFVDGDGSPDALEAAIQSGVAGGHETFVFGIEHLALTATDRVDPFNTVLDVRNSWSASWGDAGNYRIHLSTYVMLGNYCDFRSLKV